MIDGGAAYWPEASVRRVAVINDAIDQLRRRRSTNPIIG